MARQTRVNQRKVNSFAGKRQTRKSKKVATLTKPVRRAIKAIVKGAGETKRAFFYQDWNDGTVTTRATGAFGTRGWAVQNNVISSNPLDILQLIPYVAQGLDDFNRIGQKVTVSGLNINGSVRVVGAQTASRNLTNMRVVIYVWQHVQLKDYTNLYASNDFSRFLERGDGATTAFTGEFQDMGRPVAKQYYKIVKRLVLRLKFAGVSPAGAPGPTTQPSSISNSGDWVANYSMNLTKHLPKLLTYPETSNSATPQIANAPTNTSLCMSMGFIFDQMPSQTYDPIDPLPYMEQQYVSVLSYKDM